MSSTLSSSLLASLNGGTAAATGKAAASATAANPKEGAGSQAQFLKLLTTQLQNQDPLSPMDNAELTSQIAQINTVSGIATLNDSVTALSGQFMQMQALQSASLVGKQVTVPGNQLAITGGNATGGFSLDSGATAVSVQVINTAGAVVGTIELGVQTAGQHSFSWPTGKNNVSGGLTFKVGAISGNTAIGATPLMTDTVTAINTSGDSLQLELQKTGNVPYSSVRALN